MYTKFTNDKLTFLLGRSGDEIEDSIEIPEHVLAWWDDQGFEKTEEGYLVLHENQFGFLYDVEFSHTEEEDEGGRAFAEERGLTKEKSLATIQEIATQLNHKLPNNFEVMVGEETGCASRHELLIFFPYGAVKADYNDILKELIKVEVA